jgi:spermidine synthase
MRRLIGNFGKLELVAFISGFSLMAFELVGARMLAPTIGSSTYVWTSVIGVIIAALSIGYFVGGKLADLRGHAGDVAFLCLAIAFAVGCTLVLFDSVMGQVVLLADDARLQGVLASLLLFAPTSLLLGILSPYLVKLKVTSLAVAGQSVAGLSAFNSIGGIVGTFVTGFIIFSYIGSREALFAIVLLILIVSWIIEPRIRWKLRAGVSLIAVLIVMLPLFQQPDYIRIDTPSANYEVRTEQLDGYATPSIRYLTTGPNGAQSGVYTQQSSRLAFWYTQEIARITEMTSSKKNILVLGGGAFTMPEYLARKYPSSMIDVVEIDPSLVSIAEKYFSYTPLNNVRVIDDDARTYINTATKQYDVVIVDVYSDNSVPFSLLTQEYAARLNAVISVDSTVIINTIAAKSGPCQELLKTVDSTYRSFAQYASISQQEAMLSQTSSNLILAYTKHPRRFEGMKVFDSQQGSLYTDNFMPIERLQQSCATVS